VPDRLQRAPRRPSPLSEADNGFFFGTSPLAPASGY
jgi:hypothetical protein